MTRQFIFNVVRRLLGRGFRHAEVAAIDAAIDDALGSGASGPPEERTVSEAGIAFIKQFEGCRLTAYPDPGTGGEPWTIGWGTTRIGGRPVKPGMTISRAEADRLLHEDLARYAAEVDEAVGAAPTTQTQFDALVSFHYNTGAIARATLTRFHRQGEYAGAAREFSRWVHAGGRVMRGLVRRRTAEEALYSRAVTRGAADRGEPSASFHRSAGQRSFNMRRIAAALAAITLIAGAAHAQGQGQGKGNDRGGGQPAAAAQGGNGGGPSNAQRGNRRQGDGPSMASSMRAGGNQGSGNQRSDNRGNGNNDAPKGTSNDARESRGNSGANRGNRDSAGPSARVPDRVASEKRGNGRNDNSTVVIDRRSDRSLLRVRDFASIAPRGLIEGCPPGLAKKNPPCVPPGQVRNSTGNIFGFDRPDFWGLSRLADGRYFYDDGYLVRYAPSGGILGYVPLLGGALSVGNAWPSYYEPVTLPGYYESYYGLGPANSYRYADNVLYQVDPETAAITSIVALLTGDQFAVGQPMPQGYDVYNVPYGYRDRYVDGPDAYYRYGDGYIYEVDPETRLIASAIELLT